MASQADKGSYGYTRGHRFLEILGIVAFFVCVAYLGLLVARGVNGPGEILGTALCTLGGFLLADLLSGIVHWAGDTLGDENTPLLGKNFVTPFRQHHVDQKAICRHDFVETNGNNCIITVPALLLLIMIMPSHAGLLFYGCTTIVFGAWFVFCTNQFHKWAHADKPPRIALILQRAGVALAPAHHDTHHAAPHDRSYCITVGWLNPLLNKLRFFRALEWIFLQIRPSFVHLEEREREMKNLGLS